jgi:hypothetical protein
MQKGIIKNKDDDDGATRNERKRNQETRAREKKTVGLWETPTVSSPGASCFLSQRFR